MIEGVGGDDVAICIAAKCAETWLLADAAAVNEAFPGADYSVPADLEDVGAESRFREIARKSGSAEATSKIPRARKVAAHYDPERARQHSRSFDRAWRIITERLS